MNPEIKSSITLGLEDIELFRTRVSAIADLMTGNSRELVSEELLYRLGDVVDYFMEEQQVKIDKVSSLVNKAYAQVANQPEALVSETTEPPNPGGNNSAINDFASRPEGGNKKSEIFAVYCSLFNLSDDLGKIDPLLAEIRNMSISEAAGQNETAINFRTTIEELRVRIESISKAVKTNGFQLKRLN